jgi:hypothetical protein
MTDSLLKVFKQIPEEFFGEERVALPVGGGQAVAGRRGDAEAGEDRGLEARPVAHVVEVDGAGKLGEEHCREMARGSEGAGLVLDAGLTGDPVDHSEGNELEHLLEDDDIGAGWF